MHYIITGCSSGLGFEILKKILDSGSSVTGLSRTLGKAAVFENNPMFEHRACDLQLEDDFCQIDHLRDGRPITLIINAAQFKYEGDSVLSMNVAKDMFNINYFNACRIVEKFREESLARVFFVNSVAGIYAQPGQAQYSASKHALQAYADSLAKYSVGRGFDVMTMNPGGLDTELWHKNEILGKAVTDKFIKPSILADLIWNCLCLPSKTYLKSMVILPEHDI